MLECCCGYAFSHLCSESNLVACLFMKVPAVRMRLPRGLILCLLASSCLFTPTQSSGYHVQLILIKSCLQPIHFAIGFQLVVQRHQAERYFQGGE